MINYSKLPQRVRRIVKNYEYCIEDVKYSKEVVYAILKKGYESRDSKGSEIVTHDIEALIQFFKSVVKPAAREIKTALYGFKCPIGGEYVPRGSNYVDLGGLKLCTLCGLKEDN